MPTIVAAAFCLTQHDNAIFSLPIPARHDTLMHLYYSMCPEDHDYVQGFITSEGKFADRFEAYAIAIAAKQEFIRPEYQPKQLFSENLW